ncbi:hypothetical protein FBU30_003410 [Linnemannia zychae]|nr:hypothetical protein FBU30_003410 [Linnemannia zychae]
MTKIKPRLIARISCQECRRRKTRCNFDGQSQKCSTCARIGTACIFSQKNGVILDIDKVMEENNPHLVHQREKEQRAKERARLTAANSNSTSSSSSSGVKGPNLAPAPNMSIYSKSSPSSSYLSSGVHANRPSRGNSTSDALPLKSSSSTEDLSNVMDRLRIDAFGIAPHTLRSFSQVAGDNDSAETSSSELSEGESACPNNAFADPQDTKDSKSSPRINKRNSTPGSHRSSRSRSMPLIDIQPDLIDLYFQHVHPYLLVIHKPSFLRRLHDPRDPVPDFVLAAMYAAASHYAPGREQDGRRYFEFWQSRFDDTLDKPRLSTIQALLMIIKYQEGVKKTGFYFRTYMYTQMVIVLARELQLHKTTPVNAKLDPESHEVRRRLFWAIFVLDQFLSVSQGRTMSFREVEPEADLPCTDNENPNDLEEIEIIQNAVEYIKLVKIDHQALILARKFLTKVVTPEETIPQGLFLHQAMLAWKANLPARLQLAPNMSPHTPFVAMLHILYHACAIMIQRCYCEDPSVSHLEISAASRETCIISATNITVIIDDLYTNYGMLPLSYPMRGCYFIIYCLIAAATVQLSHIQMGGNGTIMFKRSLALLNIILRKSTAVDIEREVELLKSSMDSTMEALSSSTMTSSQQQDQRPAFKPILPMSQKYGSKLNFSGSGSSPIRIRKISPRVSSTSSGITSPSMGTMSHPYNNGNTQVTDSSSALMTTSKNVALDLLQSGEASLTGVMSTSNSGTCESISIANQSASKTVSDSISPPQNKYLSDDELDLKIKSSPSPDMGSRSLSNAGNIVDGSAPTDETFLRSVPTFTAPASLPTDFNAFARAQQQALATTGNQNPPPLMSLAQLLVFQQEQQRLQQQQQQRQYQVLLQQQDPALVNTFLNNFSNLINYQQLNSDQAQNELLSMLDSTMFNHGSNNSFDNNTNVNIFDNNNNSFGMNSSFLQPHKSQQSTDSFQPSMSLSPSSTSMSSTFSPDMSSSTLNPTDFASSVSSRRYHEQDKHRTFSSDDAFLAEAAMGRTHLHDTPSPETFPVLDLASSFPTYLTSESTLPFGVRQAIGDVNKIFKFEASQTGLLTD